MIHDHVLKLYFKMRLWILFMSTVPFICGQLREIEYECGAHGRFEYCIDGIPGCVIGCHCHPGYYFDTDTKICEPNIKLTQNFRRQFDYFEPTRFNGPPNTPQNIEESTTTIRNAIDEKVDNITKDADDLGDWLYNQFFKTIENQVINETKDESILTRRSGGDLNTVIKPSRRSHKYWRARKKKKRRKKKGLRSKLLRITESDSAFGSSSSSESDESSSSRESSSSGSKNSPEKIKEVREKDGHGHKKIVVFNRRPKPPLPSFIFLPNMETAFYPPIGLPPPPMPMYPMVPVPPMMGYPYAGTINSQIDGEVATTGASKISTSASSTTIKTTTTSTEIPNIVETDSSQNIKHMQNGNNPNNENLFPKSTRSRGGPQNKLMHKLREKLKRKNQLQNDFAHEYQGQSPPFMDVDPPPKCVANPVPEHRMQFPTNLAEELRGLKDVDFKYLSQLIHRADLNKSNSSTPKKHITNVPTQSAPSRRSNYDSYPDITELFYNLAQQPVNQNNNDQNQPENVNNEPNYQHYVPNQPPPPYRKKIEATNDTYYANLGRQIATMIRNIDGDKDVDIEITNDVATNSPVFNGNSQGSRSYWERSVRSPLQLLKNSLRKNIMHLKNSNENLFSLENKVEIAASTKPTLRLHELENIIRKMERVKSKLIRKHVNFSGAEPSKTSFNVNLLPKNDHAYLSIGTGNKETQNIQAKYLPFDSYTKIQSSQPPPHFEPENKAYPRDKNEKLRSQVGPENNVYTRRQSGQSPLQLELEKYFITNYHNSPPDITESRNGTDPQRNNFHAVLPSRNPNTVKAQEYSIPNTFESQKYKISHNVIENKSPNTIEAPQYKIPNNVIIRQYKRPITIAAQQYTFPNNIMEQQYKGPDTDVAHQYKIPNNFQSYAYTVLPLPLKPSLIPVRKLPFVHGVEDKPHNHQINPIMLTHKKFNYYSGNNDNQYLFEKATLPLNLPSIIPWDGRQVKPSYFHHELHHFDYFDDLI